MKWKKFETKISNFLVLNKAVIESFEPNKLSAKANISYWLKLGKLISLKKGLYLVKQRYDTETRKNLFLEYISGQLLQPSYLSLGYVMDKYQLLTEPTSAITLITTATTRVIKNSLAAFRYYSISKNLFIGYQVKYFLDASFFEATKEKAIFDFIYLRFLRNQPVNEGVIGQLRINWEQINLKEWRKIKYYGSLCRSRKVKLALMTIENLYFKK